jgi:hypothetical protein
MVVISLLNPMRKKYVGEHVDGGDGAVYEYP